MKIVDLLNKKAIIKFALVAALVLTFFVVYSPHWDYPYPYHVDEWHHISQSQRLAQGGYWEIQEASGFGAIEVGFHFVLLLLAIPFNLVEIYKYLPAIWATFTAWCFYFVVSRKTKNDLVGVLATFFFASLKSNVNILGLWFFVPMSFAMPFILLYSYYLSEGVFSKNKKFILLALAIMVVLIPFYATAVLFLIPTILIYFYFNRQYLKEEKKLFSVFLVVPILGIVFYKMTVDIPWLEVLDHLQESLQFKFGWGVLELKNSWAEMYGLAGYLLAGLGVIYVFLERKVREYAFYLIWPLTLFISIEIYREVGVSFLAPYQRNLYYFALVMPLFSALGVYYLMEQIKTWQLPERIDDRVRLLIIAALLLAVGGLTFAGYYRIPWNLDLYRVIDSQDHQTLLFMKTLPPAKVMASTFISTALYPIAGHKPYATIFFTGNREVAEQFYIYDNCNFREEVIKNRHIDYVISSTPFKCDWPLIYDKNNFVYKVDYLYLENDEQTN